MTSPRYLRFAQALALCTGLATVPACPASTTLTTDSGPPPMDTPASGTDAPTPGTDAPIVMADVPTGTDAPTTPTDAPSTGTDAPIVLADAPIVIPDGGSICDTCYCELGIPVDGGGQPNCWDVEGAGICCAVIGPLSPPDLPALA
jgi:hypothetical protein